MFQSLVGKLETREARACASENREFQSLVGKLETDNSKELAAVIEKFQSLVGKLETYNPHDKLHPKNYVSIPCR